MSEVCEIPLTQGRVALIDAEDLPLVQGYKWSFIRRPDGRGGYAITSRREGGKTRLVSMHRLIANTPAGMQTDHKNHDGLDNRRENLRPCTASQNTANRPLKPGKLKGVSKPPRHDRYDARISRPLRKRSKMKSGGLPPGRRGSSVFAQAWKIVGAFGRWLRKSGLAQYGWGERLERWALRNELGRGQ